jgi:hypothetical protein
MSAMGKRQGSGRCENLLRSLGWKVFRWARGALGCAFWEQVIFSLRGILLEQEGGVWFYHLPGGTMEIRMETQNGGIFACIFLLNTLL